MKAMIDFLMNALPWIAIGLFVAFNAVALHARKEGKDRNKYYKIMRWSPAVAFLFVGILELSSGDKSSATTWFILAAFNVYTTHKRILQMIRDEIHKIGGL